MLTISQAGSPSLSLSALCSNDVMPAPDFACNVSNASNGYVRENCNWILSRLVWDFETFWMCDETKTVLGDMLQENWEYVKKRAILACEDKREIAKPKQAGLCVSVYTALAPRTKSFLHFNCTGIFVIGVQFALSTVPYITSGNPSVSTITLAGTLLALSTSYLPAWSFPAWSSQNKSCRTNTPNSYILTRGNGAQHAILILGSKGTGVNLEDLATPPTPIPTPHRIMTAVLSLLGLLLVIGSAINAKSSSWYLLAILTLGTIHTAYLAMTPRAPAHYGIPLHFEQVIGRTKVMQTLYAVEHAYPRAGRSMRDTFRQTQA
jgi:hypothetical protein